MEELAIQITSVLSSSINKVLGIEPTNTRTIGQSNVLEYFGNYDVRVFVFITQSDSVEDIASYLKTSPLEGTNGIINKGLVVGVNSFSQIQIDEIHATGIGFISLKDPANDVGLHLINRYFEFLPKEPPSFESII